MTELSEQVAALQEKWVSVNDKASAAHARMDKLQDVMREDFNGMRQEIKDVNNQLVKLIKHSSRSRGIMLAVLAMAGVIGTFLGNVVILMFQK